MRTSSGGRTVRTLEEMHVTGRSPRPGSFSVTTGKRSASKTARSPGCFESTVFRTSACRMTFFTCEASGIFAAISSRRRVGASPEYVRIHLSGCVTVTVMLSEPDFATCGYSRGTSSTLELRISIGELSSFESPYGRPAATASYRLRRSRNAVSEPLTSPLALPSTKSPRIVRGRTRSVTVLRCSLSSERSDSAIARVSFRSDRSFWRSYPSSI